MRTILPRTATTRRAVRVTRGTMWCAAVKVAFEVKQEVQWGEVMKLVGNQGSMGNWSADKAATMGWNDGHIWRATLDVAADQDIEFKVGR